MDRETVLVNDARSPAENRPVIINRVHGFEGQVYNSVSTWIMRKESIASCSHGIAGIGSQEVPDS